MIHVAFEIAPIVRKFSGDGPFELCFERDWDLPSALFAGKIEGHAECTGCWKPFVSCTRARMTHHLHVCGQHRIRNTYSHYMFM